MLKGGPNANIKNAGRIHKFFSKLHKVKIIKSKNNFYGGCNVYEYKDVERYFNMKCNQVARSYYKKQNKAVSILENKRKEAIDHVYGMTKNNEIVVGLKKIFKGTNVKFLIGGPK